MVNESRKAKSLVQQLTISEFLCVTGVRAKGVVLVLFHVSYPLFCCKKGWKYICGPTFEVLFTCWPVVGQN